MEPFSFLTDALSGEKNITLSAIRPVLKHILENLTAPNDEDTRLAREIILAIHTDISNRYGDYGVVMLLDKLLFLIQDLENVLWNWNPLFMKLLKNV